MKIINCVKNLKRPNLTSLRTGVETVPQKLALKWLNTHHSRNKKGLGFVTRRTINPVNKKYVGLQENIICFHCGKIGHYRYTYLLRKNAMERSMLYVKQI